MRVVITLDGGIVQDVSSDESGVEVHVLDFDIDGADPEDARLTKVKGSECYWLPQWLTVNPADVNQMLAEAETNSKTHE